MANDPAPTVPADDPAASNDFGLVVDDEILAAALQAVEKVENSRRRGCKKRPAPDELPATPDTVQDLPEASDEFVIELDVDLDLEDHEDSAANDSTANDSAANDSATCPEVELLADDPQLVDLQLRFRKTRERLATSETERRRLTGALHRLEDQLEREISAGNHARDAQRAAEEQAVALRRHGQQMGSELKSLRERHNRDVGELRQRGQARALEAILPVLDHLELALAHQDGDPEKVVEGVEMILQHFHQAVQQLGVQRIGAEPGVLFDPEFHEAISEVETDDQSPGTIVASLRPGYLLNGRLLRAARVTVARTSLARSPLAQGGRESQPPKSTDTPEDGVQNSDRRSLTEPSTAPD